MKTSNEQTSEALRELMQPEPQTEEQVISPGLSISQMKALFFKNDALREPSYRLWQLNSRGGRYYYTFNSNGEPIFYPSVTTILSRVMPENRFLTEWKLSKGKEAAEEYTAERASYGTFIHGQLAQLVMNRRYNLDSLRDELAKYVERERLPYGFIDAHEDEGKADIKAFARWMQEYDVRPYAVEVSLVSSNGYAGMIDLVCNLRTVSRSDEAAARAKAGNDATKQAKIDAAIGRTDAIVDFKTGKKGFYDSHAIQLELYRRMWNENFPEKPIERIFNIAPKDWTKTVKKVPSFSFEEQTQNPVLRQVDIYLQLMKLLDEDDRTIVTIGGTIDLDSTTEDNVKLYKLPELVKEWAEKKAENGDIDTERGNTPAEGFTPVKTKNSEK